MYDRKPLDCEVRGRSSGQRQSPAVRNAGYRVCPLGDASSIDPVYTSAIRREPEVPPSPAVVPQGVLGLGGRLYLRADPRGERGAHRQQQSVHRGRWPGDGEGGRVVEVVRAVLGLDC